MEEGKCCAACVHLTPEGECDWRFEQIPEEEIYDSYCDMFEEVETEE